MHEWTIFFLFFAFTFTKPKLKHMNRTKTKPKLDHINLTKIEPKTELKKISQELNLRLLIPSTLTFRVRKKLYPRLHYTGHTNRGWSRRIFPSQINDLYP